MPRKPEVHTVPKRNGAWANKLGGKIVSKHRTKTSADDCGARLARKVKTEHAIHNVDGKIGRRNSYGNDRHPPKDKNR